MSNIETYMGVRVSPAQANALRLADEVALLQNPLDVVSAEDLDSLNAEVSEIKMLCQKIHRMRRRQALLGV
ncbi:hypothetical protein [Sphingomonas melonis]|uniref:hypothetical protein n=1 Tax=Sphingomonas melonis TaxID=152682 RepID=UPI0036DBF5AD